MKKRDLLKRLESIPDDLEIAIHCTEEDRCWDDADLCFYIMTPETSGYKKSVGQGETYLSITTREDYENDGNFMSNFEVD